MLADTADAVEPDLSDLEEFEDYDLNELARLLAEFRAYTDPFNNTGNSLTPPSIPPPPPPPPPLNIPPSRARLQLAARLAMHQKNNQTAVPSSATVHHGEEFDDNTTDPFRDGDDGTDDDDDDLDADVVRDGGRGSWWRGMVRRKSNADDGDSDEADNDDDDDDEFGDFAMAEDDKTGGTSNQEQLVLRPLAVNPAKESRGLSGLWPFGSRHESSKAKREEESRELRDDGAASADEKKVEENKAIEVREATRRTSIEEPDEEE
ncbi:hypothetical protein ED733_008910 [Metarhizium rileyi]|uniref:SIT4 phosphatase-associated protein n=1 Tax=Metarhizium rileyi (strain RCEF 4871) TaxID=1649241 RepID=A0A5C6GM11_METRR|nr:hypothetical protein ED733_008910 [Metarhizium rileyi]